MNPLDKPIRATIFSDAAARSARSVNRPLRDWEVEIRGARASEKRRLPWLKFATFGDQTSDKGSLRHDANVDSISGIEGDYDGEEMAMNEAAGRLKQAGVAAMLYETPSHAEEKPRWRVICPLSKDCAPEKRRALVEKLNGVLGGVLKSESFALSQAFFYGRDESRSDRPPQVVYVDGEAIDQVRGLDRRACGPTKGTADPDRDDTRSGRHWREALKSAVAGLCYQNHLEGLDEDLRVYADEARGRSTKGARDWERAIAETERDQDRKLDRFENHEAEEGGKTRDSTLEIFWGDADDASADMEPLIDGFLFQQTLAAIFGQFGVGKSFVAMDIALHIATGKPWQGHEVEQGPVLYVAPEGYHGLKRRRAAWCKHHDLPETPADFALVRGQLNLQRPDGATLEFLAREAKRVGAKLIVIDTLNAVFGGGDENDAAAMSKARHQLERLRDLSGATVLVVHHAGKDIDRGMRGSSVLGGALDTVLFVHNGRIISEAPKGKQKDMEAAPDMAFTLQNVDLPSDRKGRPVSSAVAVAGSIDRFEDHDKLSAHNKAALKALQRAWDFAELKQTDAVTVANWREHFYRRPEIRNSKPDAKKKAFQRARESLVRSQLAREHAGIAYLNSGDKP